MNTNPTLQRDLLTNNIPASGNSTEVNEIIERLERNIPLHMNPYNLGDQGETAELVLKLIKHIKLHSTPSPVTARTGEEIEKAAIKWVNEGTWGNPLLMDDVGQWMFEKLKEAYIAGAASLPSPSAVREETIQKAAEKKLAEMFNDNPPKLVQFMLLQIGRQMLSANAATMDMSQEADLEEGSRYKIKTICTLKKLKLPLPPKP